MPHWNHPPKPILSLVSIDEARYTVLIYETLKSLEDGYRAEVPILPGCTVEGKTQEEVLARIREAIHTYRKKHQPTPHPPPDTPPGWKGPILAWAMVLYLLEEMNEREKEYKEIETLRTTHPEEAAERYSNLYQRGFSGTSARMRHVADTLFSQGPDVALEEYTTWLLQEFPFTNPERGRQLAVASRWPPEVKAMLERMSAVHVSLAAWTLLSNPTLASRLRQCPVCSSYFITRTRNRLQRRCQNCTNRFYKRPVRRARKKLLTREAPPASGFGHLIPLPQPSATQRPSRKRSPRK